MNPFLKSDERFVNAAMDSEKRWACIVQCTLIRSLCSVLNFVVFLLLLFIFFASDSHGDFSLDLLCMILFLGSTAYYFDNQVKFLKVIEAQEQKQQANATEIL